MGVTQVSLLGQFRCRVDDAVVPGIDARRVQELFGYLLLHRKRVHHREVLANVLCETGNAAQTRKALRQALWQLQTALANHTTGNQPSLLAVDNEWVCVDEGAPLWIDVAVIEEAYTTSHTTPPADFTRTQVAQLTQAAALYTGDLLEGCYRDWCIFERERCQSMYLVLLDALTDYHEVQEEWELAIRHAHTTLRFDRARERAHRRLMRLYHAAGDRTAALRQYQTCVQVLAAELNVAPSAKTEQLYLQIAAGDRSSHEAHARQSQGTHRASGATPRSETRSAPTDRGGDLSSQLDQLWAMQATLTRLQQQLDHLVAHTTHQ